MQTLASIAAHARLSVLLALSLRVEFSQIDHFIVIKKSEAFASDFFSFICYYLNIFSISSLQIGRMPFCVRTLMALSLSATRRIMKALFAFLARNA